MAKLKPRQKSIPGTNIPELESVAEDYYAAVQARLEAQKIEATLKSALGVKVEELEKAKKVPSPLPDGNDHPVYRYTGNVYENGEQTGEVKQRVVYSSEKTTTTVAVRNAKDEASE